MAVASMDLLAICGPCCGRKPVCFPLPTGQASTMVCRMSGATVCINRDHVVAVPLQPSRWNTLLLHSACGGCRVVRLAGRLDLHCCAVALSWRFRCQQCCWVRMQLLPRTGTRADCAVGGIVWRGSTLMRRVIGCFRMQQRMASEWFCGRTCLGLSSAAAVRRIRYVCSRRRTPRTIGDC